jgi:hypothetical protein
METIIVVGIVAIVAVITGRSFYRTITGKNDGCGCDGLCCKCNDSTKGSLQQVNKREDEE